MLGRFTFFVVGVYAGIFADQHYQLPRVDNPQEMWEKVKEFVEKYKKSDDSSSKSD